MSKPGKGDIQVRIALILVKHFLLKLKLPPEGDASGRQAGSFNW
jgi:hypothetical protein